jgi:hypothetical protein
MRFAARRLVSCPILSPHLRQSANNVTMPSELHYAFKILADTMINLRHYCRN